MNRIRFLLIAILIFAGLSYSGDFETNYEQVQQRLASGWNTWNNRSVLSFVHLTDAFNFSLAFKQQYWLEEQYIAETLIGRYGKNVEQVKPGPHTLDGSYMSLGLKWEELDCEIQAAKIENDIVVLLTPQEMGENPVKLIVESGYLWNYPGRIEKEENHIIASSGNHSHQVYITAELTADPYVPTQTPYLACWIDKQIGISSGMPRTLSEIQQIISDAKTKMNVRAAQFGELSEAYLAIESGLAWNTIFEPKHQRVVSTVGRLWNQEYGGYCLFGWDNFFLSYVSSLYSKDLAYANLLEHLKGRTAEGFIPNDNRGNGSKSFDRSQPPVGSIMAKEILKKYPSRELMTHVFPQLLEWNRWWIKKRMNDGLLSYGSHQTKNPFNEPATQTKRTAGYESGMDDSPMYSGVPFNKEKNVLELQDVGLTSLVIADCNALIEMAEILGKKSEVSELKKRAKMLTNNLKKLWQKDVEFFLNKRSDTNEFSKRLSPTLFYPMLANVASKKQSKTMIEKYLLNPDEFWGDFVLPSIARSDVDFPKQRYWKGAIWPPLNFLTYLSLKNAGQHEVAQKLARISNEVFIKGWQKSGHVSENYSSITGTGDDERLSSDRFHSWGTLMGIMMFMEHNYLPESHLSLDEFYK